MSTPNWVKRRLAEAYIECSLWADFGEESVFNAVDCSQVMIDTLTRRVVDFYALNTDLLCESELELGQIGHDLWLTHNHHGSGFWDRGLGEIGEKLTIAAHKMGEVYLYVDDNGMIQIGD